jgi:hypothetical protein
MRVREAGGPLVPLRIQRVRLWRQVERIAEPAQSLLDAVAVAIVQLRTDMRPHLLELSIECRDALPVALLGNLPEHP